MSAVVPMSAEGPVETIPVPASETAAILHMIERAARDPSVDVDKMCRLLELRDRAVARQAEDEFSEAMTSAQAEMEPVRTDASNPQTKSKYASHAAVDRALRPIYSRHGFSLSFDTETVSDAVVCVKCFVSHKTPGRPGHTRTHHIDMPADGKGAKGGDVMTKTHATGAAVSYGRRYLELMIFNIIVSGEDDDGNSAAHVAQPKITKEQVMELDTLIEEVSVDKKKFLAHIKLERLEDIHAGKFDAAKAMIERKRKA